MAVGFQTANGTDFDDIFEPRTTAKRGDVGFKLSNGNDVSNRYEKASSGTPAGNIGYKLADGTDIGQLFAAKGSVAFIYAPWDNELYSVSSNCSSITICTPEPSSISLRIDTDGNIYTIVNTNETNRGKWLESGNASDYEARVIGGIAVNDYSTWQTVSSTRKITSTDSSGPLTTSDVEQTDITVTIEIRKKSNTGVSVSGDCTFRHNFSNIGV